MIHFEPRLGGSNNVHYYLSRIDYHLQRFPNATIDHKICLIKITSNQAVDKFIERQTHQVRNVYNLLKQALIKEFSDIKTHFGLGLALAVTQGKDKSGQEYYQRLLSAYFGSRNEPEMEEDIHFKFLFVASLHPATSGHLGVLANPKVSAIGQLRDLAILGFAKPSKRNQLFTSIWLVCRCIWSSSTPRVEQGPVRPKSLSLTKNRTTPDMG